MITNGYGAMYSYAARIPVGHRWAIAAYIRALQYSRDAKPEDLNAEERQDPGRGRRARETEPTTARAWPRSRNESGRDPAPPDRPHPGRALIAAAVGGGLAWSAPSFGLPSTSTGRTSSRYVFFLGLSLGSLALLMLHRQLGGAWGFLIRRPLESGAMTLPLMAVLFIPVLIDLERIYPWVDHPVEAESRGGDRPPGAVKSSESRWPRAARSWSTAGHPGLVRVRRDPLEADTAYLLEFKHDWLQPTGSPSGWRSTSSSGSPWP